MSIEQYRLPQPLADAALLYFIFLSALAAAQVARAAGRVLFALLVLAFSLALVIQAVHADTFGFPIGPDGYRAILQSNPGEALEFIGRHLGPGGIVAAALALVVAAAVALRVVPPRAPREALGWCAVFALPLFAILQTHAELVMPRLQGFGEAADYFTELMEYRAVRQARRSRPPAVSITQEGALAGRAQTYVFVVGESLTRNHMSLYGYWRDTTPELSRLSGELAVFRDVVSPHSHTDQSLELVLTLANQRNGLSFTDAKNYSLIELLRAAGFATWWISNQNTFGPWDNKVSVLGSAADHVHYTGHRSGAMVTGPYDDALLEPFAAALRDGAPRKAIFLHVLGNHWEYAKRYPPEAAVFRKHPSAAEIGALSLQHPRPEMINDYDNAVRYHDGLMVRFIELLRASAQPAVLIRFSDHGESVYGFKGHYWRQFTHDHVEVPLILWFSPQYASLAPTIVKRARANAQLPFALEDLSHLVADLAGLRGAVFDPKLSPLSGAYSAPRERPLFEGSLVYEQADEPTLNARRALQHIERLDPKLASKVWAHRVDTLGKMMEVAQIFAGAEIDVLYDAQRRALMVNHPPEPPSGLTLDALLAYANGLNAELKLWLDVKNLNEANGPRVLEELRRLDARHGLRARALVETDHTGPAAAALRAAGFRSSYYLPPSLLTQNSGSSQNFSCYGAADIRRAVMARRFAAISYDWRGKSWVERCLGGFVRERGLRSYVWDLEPTLSDMAGHEALYAERLRAYSAMSAVLLPYRSVFDDWR